MNETPRKLLGDIVPLPTAEQIAFEKRANDEITNGPEAKAAMALVDRLRSEVENMPIASRFRTDIPPRPYVNGYMVINPNELNEAEYKRKQLIFDLEKARIKFISAYSELRDVVLDMDATKTESTPAEETEEK